MTGALRAMGSTVHGRASQPRGRSMVVLRSMQDVLPASEDRAQTRRCPPIRSTQSETRFLRRTAATIAVAPPKVSLARPARVRAPAPTAASRARADRRSLLPMVATPAIATGARSRAPRGPVHLPYASSPAASTSRVTRSPMDATDARAARGASFPARPWRARSARTMGARTTLARRSRPAAPGAYAARAASSAARPAPPERAGSASRLTEEDLLCFVGHRLGEFGANHHPPGNAGARRE